MQFDLRRGGLSLELLAPFRIADLAAIVLAIFKNFDLQYLAFGRNRDGVIDLIVFAHDLIDHQNTDRVRILSCDTEMNLGLSDLDPRFFLNRFALLGAQPEKLRFEIVGVGKTNLLRLRLREVMLRLRQNSPGEPECRQQQLRRSSAWAFQVGPTVWCVGWATL